ncbi:phage/plasmid primase, P4 family [Mesorhizobium yinganensis]|uniref:phage/plasmid primase, P4 family n=1 Tax=Mesorhizobium yinganensis TaxID=3157707 RepID=UPI0032B700EF
MSPKIELCDIDEARRFLEVLDPEASKFTFQTFDDDKDRKEPALARTLHGSLDEHATALQRLNDRGAGVFVTVNETNGKARTADDIVRVRAVFVDLDGAPIEPVERYICPPHMVVETSEGKWHAYWSVDGLQLNEFEAAQKALIERFHADKMVKDLPRVMRLPGFFHRKGQPQKVRIKRIRQMAAYAADQFRQQPAAASTSAPRGEKSEDGDSTEALRVLDAQCARVASTPDGSKARNNNLNIAAYTVGGLVGAGLLDESDVRERLLTAADDCGLKRKEANLTVTSGLTAGKKAPWKPSLVLDPQDPMRSARKLVNARYMHESGSRLIHRHKDASWCWNGSCFELLSKEDIRAVVYSFAERARMMTKEGPTSFKPNQDKVSNIVDALNACTHLNDNFDTPTWLRGGDDLPPPSEFMAVANGLLHLPSCELWKPTPNFFNTAASTVAFDPDAPSPRNWLAFLKQIFVEDIEAQQALQEFFGYCLSTDTSQQKILLIKGPPRSGKGTSARVLRELVGPNFVAGPTMGSLSGEFGLEPLIPRPVAIISDARIGGKTDKAAVTERLLAISGEDTMSANRKNNSFWHGKLQTRFIIITNELPALADGSGALANRFIIIVLEPSFLGNENPGLFDGLKPEMPGILNWAIEGYHRLRNRRHFVQPTSSQDALNEIIQLGSPAHAFVAECCNVGAGIQSQTESIWEAWKAWCVRNGNNQGSKSWFSRNLKSAVPGLRITEHYDGGERQSYYVGIDVAKEKKEPLPADVPF